MTQRHPVDNLGSIKRLINFAQIFLAQRTHRRFQAQPADQVVVLGLVQIAAGGIQLLLRIRHIEIGAHAASWPSLLVSRTLSPEVMACCNVLTWAMPGCSQEMAAGHF